MKQSQGFTLIEIMVVVIILGILTALVAPRVLDRIIDARIQSAKTQIQTIESALSLYKMDNFNYPTTEQGIRALVERPAPSDAPNWKVGGYLKKFPVDPWGSEFLYTNDGEKIDIYTLGSDSQPGGEGEAGDIHWVDL